MRVRLRGERVDFAIRVVKVNYQGRRESAVKTRYPTRAHPTLASIMSSQKLVERLSLLVEFEFAHKGFI